LRVDTGGPAPDHYGSFYKEKGPLRVVESAVRWLGGAEA
jgi:hypothetical protein